MKNESWLQYALDVQAILRIVPYSYKNTPHIRPPNIFLARALAYGTYEREYL